APVIESLQEALRSGPAGQTQALPQALLAPSPPQPGLSAAPPVPVAARPSPARQLIRLSIVVYGAVLVVAALALAAWLWLQRPPRLPGMIYIPAGPFLAGEDKHAQKLKAFYIDATEVTNADFAEFCRAMGCAPPTAMPDLPVVNVSISL